MVLLKTVIIISLCTIIYCAPKNCNENTEFQDRENSGESDMDAGINNGNIKTKCPTSNSSSSSSIWDIFDPNFWVNLFDYDYDGDDYEDDEEDNYKPVVVCGSADCKVTVIIADSQSNGNNTSNNTSTTEATATATSPTSITAQEPVEKTAKEPEKPTKG